MTVIVEVALGDVDLTIDPDQYDWSDWSVAVERDEQGVYCRRGYGDGSDDPSATEIRFRGKSRTTAGALDLRWHVEHPNNPYFGQIHERTPIRVSRDIGGVTVRATAQLAEWSIVEDAAGAYIAVDIVAYGPIYWAESDAEVESILYRQIVDIGQGGSLLAYWPGEDGQNATSLRSAVPGQPGATSLYLIDTGADSDVIGSKPLWTFREAGSWVRAVLGPYVRPSPEAWAVALAVKIPEEPAGAQPFFAAYTDGGTIRRWLFLINPGTPATLQIKGENAAGTDVLTGTTTVEFTHSDQEPWGRLVRVVLHATQNGADIDWSLWGPSSGQSGTVTTQTLGPVNLLAAGPDAGITGWTMGHWQVWNNVDDWAFINYDGFIGEDLWTAWFRALVDAGMPVSVYGSATTTSTTGVLVAESPISRMKLLVRSEGGLMFETPGGTVTFALRDDLHAQAPALTIDRDNKQIKSLLALRDSFRRANRVTVSNAGAGGATADAPYPHDPTTVGYVLPAPALSVNLESDAQALGAAQFEAAQQAHPDLRYRIGLELMGPAAGLRATYLSAVDIGSRILITDNPTYSSLDPIDQQVMGIEEWHTIEGFDVLINTRPAGPWVDAFIAETGSGNLSRADTAGCALLVAVDDNDTALLVGTRGRPEINFEGKWSTSSGLPYDLALRTRDRVTCTAVTNRTPVFVAAGAAAHADNAAITPGAAAGMAAGDCEILLVAVRDSTGFAWPGGIAGRRALLIGDQTGWTRLAEFGGANGCFQLWARTWQDNTLTPPPLLTPQSGVAGDTISAQLCAFRYVQPVTHTAALAQTNAAATNIAYPGLGIIRPSCVALLAVQREDDWGSVATPAGWTEIGEPDSALGGGQGIAWYYQVQTTATNTAAGSAVVTGGSGVSRATVVSLISDVQTLTVTRAVNGAVTSHPVGADVRLWRGGRATR